MPVSPKYTLVLTACIEPTAFVNINQKARRDTLTRLEDYKTTLSFWLNYGKVAFNGIIFVENSCYDLQALKKIVAENNPQGIIVEFLQKRAGAIPEGLNYGYSELEMLDYAFENSKLIKVSDYIIKATGRLYFPKLDRLLKKLPKGYKIAIDSRDYELFNVQKHYLVTTIFIVQKDFYNFVLHDAKSKMLPGPLSYIERIYYHILKPLYKKNSGLILRLPLSMNPVGFGGHWNINYSSRKKRLAAVFRDTMRIITPWFWV